MKSKNVFFIGNHGHDLYFKEVVKRLVARDCIYGYMSHALMETEDEKLCFLDSTLLYRHQHFEQAFVGVNWSFGSRVNIDTVTVCRAEVYAALDRISPYLKPMSEKESYFNKLAGYCIGFFERNTDITKIVTRQTPHMPWDILFCRIAILFGVKVYSVNRGVPGFAVIWDGIGDSAVKLKGNQLIKSEVKKLYETVIEHNSTNRSYVKTFLPQVYNKNNVKKMLLGMFPFLRFLALLKVLLLKPVPLKVYPATLNTKPLTNFAGEEQVSRLRYVLTMLLYNRERLKREKFLKQMAIKTPDYDSQYVYFALHFQPESTTLPKGSIYRDQILAIKRLREILPAEMMIYVKEHPRSLIADIRNKNFRSIDFYREIMMLEGIQLLHPEVDSAELIENSSLVSTITGSPLIEALPQGVPAVAFGNSIVEGCESLHKIISSTVSNRSAVEKLLRKSPAEVKADFLNFLKCPDWHKVCDNERSWKQVDCDREYVNAMVDLVVSLGDQAH
jgi:hypothetical protein